MLFWLCGAVLAAAILAGGGTHSGFYGDVFVQLLSIPLLAAVIWPAFSKEHPCRKRARLALGLCGLIVFTGLFQLLPFSLHFWYGEAGLFDGRIKDAAAGSFGFASPSLAPEGTWAAIASFLVPLSIFGAALQLGRSQRMHLCFLVLGLGAASLLLGFLQMAQGPGSQLRFYEYTNTTEAVGFFANRNHFAAYLNVTLVLAGVWFVMTVGQVFERGAFESRSLLWFAAAGAFLVADVAGLAMARSRAGLVLAMAALAGTALMAVRQWARGLPSKAPPRLGAKRAFFAVALFAVIFAAQFGLGSILSRFQGDSIEDLRVALNRTTFDAVLKTLPTGTGLGSFVPVYATVEEEEDAFTGYANRAHNDLAELLLETGLIGGGLLLAFLAWFGKKAYLAWSQIGMDETRFQLMLERAATLIVTLLLAHSLVDYPLRTMALGGIFAFFCAILAAPAHPFHEENSSSGRDLRRQKPGPSYGISAPPAERWGSNADWPDEWLRK
jgi:O-antigen ligase